NRSPRRTAACAGAVGWANSTSCETTIACRNSRKNPTGFPSAYFVTSSGKAWVQRAEAVGTGRNPHASVIVSLVKIALADQTPTAIRRNASQRSGERIGAAVDTRESTLRHQGIAPTARATFTRPCP